MSVERGTRRPASAWGNPALSQWALRASAVTVAGGMFGIIWQYGPESIFKPPASHYIIAVLAGIVGFIGVQIARARAKNPAATLPASVMPRRHPPLEKVAAQMQASVSTDPLGNQGWCHYLGTYAHKQNFSALSTAYALRVAVLCNMELQGIDVSRITSGIVAKANRDGGWSAQSQGNLSRPEVTAVVGGTLARICGFIPVTQKAAQLLQDMIASEADPLITTSTYVVATLLEEAPYLRLPRQQVDRLLDCLLSGAVPIAGGEAYWTEHLVDPGQASPSIALTAHALIAIRGVIRNGQTIPGWGSTIANGAAQWLGNASDLHNETSQVIRYPRKGVQELNVPRHFTAALVILALIGVEGVNNTAIQRAFDKVWSQYHNGLWWWDSGEAPTWMTYYGFFAVLSAHLFWAGDGP
jgi:hypothetical protein